jgi:hypothetical protein
MSIGEQEYGQVRLCYRRLATDFRLNAAPQAQVARFSVTIFGVLTRKAEWLSGSALRLNFVA